MLCFAFGFQRLMAYFRGRFPLLFEQVGSSLWIEILLNFTVGNLGTMFLTSIVIIFFELPDVTLQTTSYIAALGGRIQQFEREES